MRNHGADGLTRDDWRDGAALLILRAGLVWFMFLWAIHKIITPKQYKGLVKHFDGIEVSLEQVYLTGGVQILICLMALIGVFRPFAYGGLLAALNAALGQHLDRAIVAGIPAIQTGTFRSAVYLHLQRILIACLVSHRFNQNAGNTETIRTFPGDGFLLPKFHVNEVLI